MFANYSPGGIPASFISRNLPADTSHCTPPSPYFFTCLSLPIVLPKYILFFQAIPLSSRSPPHFSFFILGLTLSLSNAVFAFLLGPPPPPHPPSSQLLFVSTWLAPVDMQAYIFCASACGWALCVCAYALSSLNARAPRLPGYHQRPSLGCHLNGLPRSRIPQPTRRFLDAAVDNRPPLYLHPIISHS